MSYMPTSSWEKNFYVPKEKENEFLEEMERDVPPTLPKSFKSQLKTGKEAKEYLEKIGEALNNEDWNPLTKNFALNAEQTKKLLEIQQQQTEPNKYQKNNRVEEGKRLLKELSEQYSKNKTT